MIEHENLDKTSEREALRDNNRYSHLFHSVSYYYKGTIKNVYQKMMQLLQNNELFCHLKEIPRGMAETYAS